VLQACETRPRRPDREEKREGERAEGSLAPNGLRKEIDKAARKDDDENGAAGVAVELRARTRTDLSLSDAGGLGLKNVRGFDGRTDRARAVSAVVMMMMMMMTEGQRTASNSSRNARNSRYGRRRRRRLGHVEGRRLGHVEGRRLGHVEGSVDGVSVVVVVVSGT
jgi:hypothetical protein